MGEPAVKQALPSQAKNPLILDIKGNSLDDGPGIRSVVFFKGCPLSCVWCHNPESQKTVPELAFDPKKCVACDTCLSACAKSALDRNLAGFVDRGRCDLCGDCSEACPSGALEMVGTRWDLEKVLAKVLRDKPFYDTSGGGVTLSGGEPSLFPGFVSGLLKKLKENQVHTLMETCGLFNGDKFMEKLFPHLDAIYFDIKIMDPDNHKKYCGVSNERILENFQRLAQASRESGTVLLPRMPLVPGITALKENVEAAAAFVKQAGVKEFKLLAYNPLWPEKTLKIGQENPLSQDEAMQKWMPAEDIQELEEIVKKAGLEN